MTTAGSARVRLALTGIIRLGGIAAIAYLATRGDFDSQIPARVLAIAGLTCAWLFVTGFFGFGSWNADDWPAAPLLALALAVRLLLVRAGTSELTVYLPALTFDQAWLTDRHSVIYAAWRSVFMTVWGPSHSLFMLINGVAGAAALVPLYLFVRRRFDDRSAAIFAGIIFSVHPLLAREAPTDVHGAFLVFFLLWGLALLSDVRGWREITGGFLCLGLAATLRIEAAAYSAAVLPLVDWRRFSIIARRRPAAGAAALAAPTLAATLVGGNLADRLFSWSAELPLQAGWWPGLAAVLRARTNPWICGPLFDVLHAGDGLLLVLFWVGVFAAIALPRFRIGLFAAAAAGGLSIFVLDCGRFFTPVLAHRFNVVWVLQAMVGGIGASALTGCFAERRQRATVALAALLVVFVPLRHLNDMRREHAFNAEYDLVKTYVAPSASGRACTVFFFDDGDMGLTNPEDVVPGVDAVNCAWRDCAARVRRGGCLYVLRGIGCSSRGQAPEKRNGRALKDLCGDLFAMARVRTLAERFVSFVEAYGPASPPGKFPAAGTIGIYQILGPR